jgi:hypothetical protein
MSVALSVGCLNKSGFAPCCAEAVVGIPKLKMERMNARAGPSFFIENSPECLPVNT